MPQFSIEPVRRVLSTGQRPAIIACNDLEDYCCKSSRTNSEGIVMTEWICSNAALACGLRVPHFDVIHLSDEHVTQELLQNSLPLSRFDSPLFGSRMIKAQDVNQLTLQMMKLAKHKSRIADKDELLKIALFDIWVGNDDRHGGNYNLLLEDNGGRLHWYMIDFDACFNTRAALTQCLTPLTQQDSIIDSPLFAAVYQKPVNFVNRIHAVCSSLEIWHQTATQQCEQWVVNAPLSWGVDRNQWISFLRNEWLSENWLSTAKRTFLELMQQFQNP